MCMLENQINSSFIRNTDPQRIHQGDLLSNVQIQISSLNENKDIEVTDINFPYVVVLSQDCDLKQYFEANKKARNEGLFNQYLPNVLIAPCYFNEDFKSGENLAFLNINQNRKSSEQLKFIKQERDPRYHYIKANEVFNIPDLYIDFKIYYAIPPTNLFSNYNSSYVATINALFRERLTQRYSNYISRIGLPCL